MVFWEFFLRQGVLEWQPHICGFFQKWTHPLFSTGLSQPSTHVLIQAILHAGRKAGKELYVLTILGCSFVLHLCRCAHKYFCQAAKHSKNTVLTTENKCLESEFVCVCAGGLEGRSNREWMGIVNSLCDGVMGGLFNKFPGHWKGNNSCLITLVAQQW